MPPVIVKFLIGLYDNSINAMLGMFLVVCPIRDLSDW